MGPNEKELRAIAAAGDWLVPDFQNYIIELIELSTTLRRAAGDPGWTGSSATAASAELEEFSRLALDVVSAAQRLRDAVDDANRARRVAADQSQSLPSTFVPSWIYDAVNEGGKQIEFMGWYFDAVESSIDTIGGLLGNNREEAAAEVLRTYSASLQVPQARVDEAGGDVAIGKRRGDAMPKIRDTGDDDSTVTPYGGYPGPGGSFRTPGGGGTGYRPKPFDPPVDGPRPPYDPPVRPPLPPEGPRVDDPGPGYVPGPGGGGPGSGPGVIGGPGGGSGIPGGLGNPGATGAGVGVGAAALATGVGVKASGLGALGAAGAAARPGSGGLLGGGGAAGAPASRGGAAAGRGSGLLGKNGQGAGGAGAQGANRDDKKKRTPGRGLGGPIAPQLEDTDEYVPRAAGTRAGGRDDAAEPAEPTD